VATVAAMTVGRATSMPATVELAALWALTAQTVERA